MAHASGASSTTAAWAPLVEAVQWSVNNSLWSNATFLAERLYAAAPSDETLRILADVFHKHGRINRAYNLLKLSPHPASPQTRYLLAVCCFELGKFNEAELALEYVEKSAPISTSSSAPTDHIPNGAAGFYLLGMICKKANQKERASTYFKKSLELNPFLWSSYEALCLMGEPYDATEAFAACNNKITVTLPSSNVSSISIPSLIKAPTSISDIPLISTPTTAPTQSTFAKPASFSLNPPQTPTLNPALNPNASILSMSPIPTSSGLSFVENASFTSSSSQRNMPGLASLLVPSPLSPAISSAGLGASPAPGAAGAMGGLARRRRIEEPKRKGQTRLFPDDSKGKSTKSRLSFASNAEGKKPAEPEHKSLQPTSLAQLFITLGTAFRLLCEYKCKEAIAMFHQLPISQYQTGWVLCQVGRAYFEMVDYAEAQIAFQQARKIDPNRVEGMEIYSTILWHLRRDSELSYLAHELVEIDKLAPQSWCVVGNCFSLQKEHETALKFFQRAIQLDNSFTYAYTLCGHEYVANDDLEKALKFFRYALDMDPRHYNAWYGLGMIYFRQEKYDLAEYHFKRALQINTISSVLYCYYGMISHAHNKPEQALDALQTAINIDPNNILAKFKKASVLVSLERLHEALDELLLLKDSAPKEAPIYFLMGRIYRKLNLIDKATVHYTMALDLDPKNANYIKSVIEKIHTDPEEDEDNNNELT